MILDLVRCLALSVALGMIVGCGSQSDESSGSPSDETAVAPAPAIDPTALSLIDRHFEAAGGRDAFEAVVNRRVTGTLEVAGMTGAFTSDYATDRLRTEASFGTFEMSQGRLDDLVWSVDPQRGPRILDGLERAFVMRFDALMPLGDYDESTLRSAGAVGPPSFSTSPWDCATFTSNDGLVHSLCFDQETGLLAAIEAHVGGQVGTVRIVMKDYRPVDGLLLPHEITTVAGGQVQVATVQSIVHRPGVDPADFEIPAAVERLRGG